MNDLDAIFDARTQRLPGTAYKLANGGSYGMSVVIPDVDLDIDEKRMACVIPFADGNRRDGVGDVTEVTGLVTDRHRLNPICLFDHGKKVELPIGLAEDPDSKAYTVEIDAVGRLARGRIFFYQGTGIKGLDKDKEYAHAVYCEQLFHMLSQRLIRGGSFGYQIVKAMQLQPDYERGTPPGLHLLQTLLLEFGPTVLPANMDTVRKCLAMNPCCGKPLSPIFVKSLEGYVEDEKTQVSFATHLGQTKFSPDHTLPDHAVPHLTLPHRNGKDIVGNGEAKAIAGNPLNEQNVPPAKWKPGAGAEKLLAVLGKSQAPLSAEQLAKELSVGVPEVAAELFLLSSGPGAKAWQTRDQRWTLTANRQKNLKSLRAKYKSYADEVVRLYNSAASIGTTREKIEAAFAGLGGEGLSADELRQVAARLDITRRLGRSELIDAMRQTVLERYGAYRRVNASLPEGSQRAKSAQDDSQDWDMGYERGQKDAAEQLKKYGKVPEVHGRPTDEPWEKGYTSGWNAYRNTLPNDQKSLKKSVEKARHPYDQYPFLILAWPEGASKNDIYGADDEWQARNFAEGFSRAIVRRHTPTGFQEIAQVNNYRTIGGKDLRHAKAVVEDRGRYRIEQWEDGKLWVTRPGPAHAAGGRSHMGPFDSWAELEEWIERNKDKWFLKSAKALAPIRVKYRKAAKHCMRKSVAGSSVLHVDAKDIDELKGRAGDSGLDFKRIGTAESGAEKVKLTGDDKAIDELAKRYGRKVKAMGRQTWEAYESGYANWEGQDKWHIATQDGRVKGPYNSKKEAQAAADQENMKTDSEKKNMPTKQITREVKDAPPGLKKDLDETQGTETAPEEGNAPEEGEMRDEKDMADEKYSAQVLRQLHEDALILLEEYDAARGPLEHVEIDSHLQAKLEGLVAEIEEIEGLFAKHHPDAEPLGDGSSKSADEDAAEEVEDEEEDTPADEAVEGMTKALPRLNHKSLRAKYGKDQDGDEKKDKEDKEKAMKNGKPKAKTAQQPKEKWSKSAPGDEENQDKPGHVATGSEIPNEPGSEENQPKPGAVATGDEIQGTPGNEEHQEKPGQAGGEADFTKALHPHEKKAVGEAAQFAAEVAGTESGAYGDEHRMKAYHFFKSLGGVGFAEMDAAAATVDVTKDMPAMDAQEEAVNVSGAEKSLHPHRKTCKDASGFFKALAYEKAFGDNHRAKAAEWHKALDPIASQDEAANVQEPDATPAPGDMGEKGGVNRLKGIFEKQMRDIETLRMKMQTIKL